MASVKAKLKNVGALLVLAGALIPGLPNRVAAQAGSDLLRNSSIVFVGIVDRIGSAAVAEVPKSPNEIVVKVEAIIEQPTSLQLKSGSEITVLLQTPAQLKSGTRATFYANPWILGRGFAVREVGHEVIQTSQESAVETSRARIEQSTQELETNDLRARINTADAVVVGHVSVVRPAPPGLQRAVTEHDPEWKDAIVDVISWIKGSQHPLKIVVRFAASRDVTWYGAPKLMEGNENVFILKKYGPAAGTATAKKATGQAYVVLSSKDLLPKQQADRVRALASESASAFSQ